MTLSADLVLEVRNSTGESPVWRSDEAALYWVDIPERKLLRYSPADGACRVWLAPEMLACIVPAAGGGRWFAGCESGMFEIRFGADREPAFHRVATVHHRADGMRFNDGRCDRQGRFLAGTMMMNMAAAQPLGSVYRLDGDNQLTGLLHGFMTPNGMAFSPDGRTMYLSDSHPSVRRVWAYDYDVDEGIPAHPRLFIDMANFAGRPDGAAMDTDGGYWICGNDAGLVHRYMPSGRLDRSVRVAAAKPAMCAFGGTDLRTLFITSIRPAGVTSAAAPDGGLFAIQLADVQGMPEPVCSLRLS